MESALSPPDDSEKTALELLERLRCHPDLLKAVENASPVERVNQKKLRKEFPPELVREAVSLYETRQRGRERLPHADHLWLTRTGLEQATTWDVAVHKAKRFKDQSTMADLCCGIGIDTAALSKNTSVLAIDSSSSMVRRATWNSEILGNPSQVTGEVDDVTCREWTDWFVHADPDRRGDRPRPTRHLEAYLPDIQWMQRLIETARGGAIKVGPASNWPQHFATGSCEIELISLAGECREATIWFGELAGQLSRRATNLTTGESLAGDPSLASRKIAPIDAFICEPDPAVIRAGLLETLAENHGFSRIDYEEEYLTASQKPQTSLVTPFAVEAVLPAGLKHVRRYFIKQPRHHYEIKCRRLSVDVESVRRRLPVGDGQPATVIFCLLAGQSQAVVARRL
ncbi:MAG: hypothetical protein ISR34_06385 [Pirellulales bacterium]|nr:hypothetical protein [Pirellulales bacterium]